MALNDVFQITHDMTVLGKNVISVYHVLRANPLEVSANINDSFNFSILPALRGFQSNELTNNELRIFNLGDPTDFKTTTLSAAPGFRAGEDSPVFVSACIRFPSINRLVRAGFKRFPGTLESDYFEGVLAPASITLLETIRDALLANWLASSDSHHVCNYIILKRVCAEVDPVTGKCLKYRLPESDGELVFYQPVSGVVPTQITSQVSRKL